MPNPTHRPAETHQPVDIAALRDASTQAARILTAPPRRAAAITYLGQRGINGAALAEDWPLGYAPPGWTRLTDGLRARGFTDDVLLQAGLARRCSRGTLIDTFRDRVIFPIHQRDGSVAGFIGRDLSGGPAAPKYLNTPETPLFSKGTLLYGLHEARTATPRAIRPVLVEGPLDVIAITTRARLSGDLDLMPLTSCGTAVTATQATLIAEAARRHDVPVVVAMDSDAAGRTAALAAGEQLRQAGLDVKVAVLPNGTDPADHLANPGNDLGVFRQSGALPLLTVQVQHRIAAQGDRMQWVEGRLAAARSIAAYLTTYPADYAIAQTRWISTILDIAPTTFATALGEAFRDVHPLLPARTRTGDLLRGAADATSAAVSKRETTFDPAWTPTVSL